MVYRGIEMVLMMLKLKFPECVAHIYLTEKESNVDVEFEIEEKKGHLMALRLPTVADAIQCIIEHLATRKEVWIGYEEWKIYNYFPSTESNLLYLEDFHLLKLPGKSKEGERKIPVVEFKDGTICSRIDEYLDYFKLDNNYYNRGRIRVWLNSLDGPIKRARRRKQKFNPKKVISFEVGQNRFGKPTAILRYQHLPPMVGLGPILDTFPELTKSEIRDLYQQYDIKLPSTFNRVFKNRPDVLPEDPIIKDSSPKKKTIDYYGAKYKLYRTKQGYLNFVGGLGEMVAINPDRLYGMLSEEGEKVSRKQVNKIWSSYMEGGEP